MVGDLVTRGMDWVAVCRSTTRTSMRALRTFSDARKMSPL